MLTSLNFINTGTYNFKRTVNIGGKIIYFDFERIVGNVVTNNWFTLNTQHGTDMRSNSRNTSNKVRGFSSAYFSGTANNTSAYSLILLPSIKYTVNGISISFWIKRMGNSQSDHHLTSLGSLYIWGSGSSATYNINNNTNTNFTLTDNTWHHIVVTYTSSNVVNIYRDTVRIVTNTGVSGIYPSSTQNISGVIGGARTASSALNMNGYIDEYRIYNKILTNDEIIALYTHTST